MTRPIDKSTPNHVGPALGAAYGLVAGLLMVVATAAMRLTWDTSSILELAADWFTEFLPASVLDYLLETLTFSAKPLMFVGLLLAQIIVGGTLGAVYARIASRWPVSPSGDWQRAIAFAAALWLLSMVTMVPVFGGGLFGTEAPGGASLFMLTTLASYAVYGLALGFAFGDLSRPAISVSDSLTRRALLKRVGMWALAVGLIGYAGKYIFELAPDRMSSSRAHRTGGVLSTEITPNFEFYVVSKNFVDPQVSEAGWSLDIGGLVERPFSLSMQDLRAMPSVERFVTLECISNPVGGDLISNAVWRGVPLRALLEESLMSAEARDVSFEAEDGYSESITVEKAMSDEVMVVFEMNGAPLPDEHGFPARLIITGFFGLKSVKWLKKIEPVDEDFQGYWQRRGWTDDPLAKTMSRIDSPAPAARLPFAPIDLGGVAFAGDRGIQRVEISTDKGFTWRVAETMSKPLSPYTWVIWQTTFTPSVPGDVEFRVRATDGAGIVQTDVRMNTLPSGATGHDRIKVKFSEPVG